MNEEQLNLDDIIQIIQNTNHSFVEQKHCQETHKSLQRDACVGLKIELLF